MSQSVFWQKICSFMNGNDVSNALFGSYAWTAELETAGSFSDTHQFGYNSC